MEPERFPLFRRYSDLNTWFKIISVDEFIEVKRIGKYFTITSFKAKIHPERMFILDLINCEVDTIVKTTETEFDQLRKQWEKELIKKEI